MGRKKKEPEIVEIQLPAFEVTAVQHVTLNFPRWDYGYGMHRHRVDNLQQLTREQAKELADALALAANKINE